MSELLAPGLFRVDTESTATVTTRNNPMEPRSRPGRREGLRLQQKLKTGLRSAIRIAKLKLLPLLQTCSHKANLFHRQFRIQFFVSVKLLTHL